LRLTGAAAPHARCSFAAAAPHRALSQGEQGAGQPGSARPPAHQRARLLHCERANQPTRSAHSAQPMCRGRGGPMAPLVCVRKQPVALRPGERPRGLTRAARSRQRQRTRANPVWARALTTRANLTAANACRCRQQECRRPARGSGKRSRPCKACPYCPHQGFLVDQGGRRGGPVRAGESPAPYQMPVLQASKREWISSSIER